MTSPCPTPDPGTGHRDLERLCRAHQTMVWRYLRFLGCDAGEADDLTQETFLAVVGRPVHRFGAAGAAAYLRRVARNFFLKHVARRQRDPGTVDLATAEQAFEWFRRDGDRDGDGDGDGDGEDTVAALRACLEELPAAGRRALDLRYAERLDRAAIAGRLGIGQHGVKSLLQRSYARLRACIERRLGRARS